MRDNEWSPLSAVTPVWRKLVNFFLLLKFVLNSFGHFKWTLVPPLGVSHPKATETSFVGLLDLKRNLMKRFYSIIIKKRRENEKKNELLMGVSVFPGKPGKVYSCISHFLYLSLTRLRLSINLYFFTLLNFILLKVLSDGNYFSMPKKRATDAFLWTDLYKVFYRLEKE